MKTYRITLVSKRLNLRRELDVKAESCLEAIKHAKHVLGADYNMVESARCISLE